jgi:hypothetical protein
MGSGVKYIWTIQGEHMADFSLSTHFAANFAGGVFFL